MLGLDGQLVESIRGIYGTTTELEVEFSPSLTASGCPLHFPHREFDSRFSVHDTRLAWFHPLAILGVDSGSCNRRPRREKLDQFPLPGGAGLFQGDVRVAYPMPGYGGRCAAGS
jgi:hypothetical protein